MKPHRIGSSCQRSLAPAIQPASVYNFSDLDELEQYYTSPTGQYLYARDGHPNADDLAALLVDAHGAQWGCVTSSGMSAIAAVFLSCLGQANRLVASRWLYGKTTALIMDFQKRGTQVDWFYPDQLETLKKALRVPASLVFVESISNPLVRVSEIDKISEICAQSGSMLIVDNTFPTPALLKPLFKGADIVVESLTKLVNGHSDATLGFICGKSSTQKTIVPMISLYGMNSSPFDCWLTARGFETLHLRVQASHENSTQLARWLSKSSGVMKVHHPSLEHHPEYAAAMRLMPQGTCNIVSFEVPGGREGVQRFIKNCPDFTLSPSLGHTATTFSYPSGTSHRSWSETEKIREGISPGLIRVSVGIEPIDQIIGAFKCGLLHLS
jgi:cystathionine beta-lyase/cystathionine gamma-synthase